MEDATLEQANTTVEMQAASCSVARGSGARPYASVFGITKPLRRHAFIVIPKSPLRCVADTVGFFAGVAGGISQADAACLAALFLCIDQLVTHPQLTIWDSNNRGCSPVSCLALSAHVGGYLEAL